MYFPDVIDISFKNEICNYKNSRGYDILNIPYINYAKKTIKYEPHYVQIWFWYGRWKLFESYFAFYTDHWQKQIRVLRSLCCSLLDWLSVIGNTYYKRGFKVYYGSEERFTLIVLEIALVIGVQWKDKKTLPI